MADALVTPDGHMALLMQQAAVASAASAQQGVVPIVHAIVGPKPIPFQNKVWTAKRHAALVRMVRGDEKVYGRLGNSD